MSKVIFMRKLQDVSPREWYVVEYDFDIANKDRLRFYSKVRALLGSPIREHTLTTSVLMIENLGLASKIYDLAVQHGAKGAAMRIAKTIKTHKEGEADVNET